jgi:hypothetical protein
LQADFFHVLKDVFVSENKDSNSSAQRVCEALLRDTFFRVADAEPALLQMLLQNMCTFIEEVYWQEYNVELIICKSSLDFFGHTLYKPVVVVGQQLTQIARRMSDGTFEGADPSPLIVISALLLLRNKKQFKVVFCVTRSLNCK